MKYKYHYTYKITNIFPTDERQYYIGVRSCNCLPEKDNYWGSSKYLTEAIELEGKSYFVKEILSMWPTRLAAATEEIRLHEKFEVGINPKYYNRSKAKYVGFDVTGVKLIYTDMDSFKQKAYNRSIGNKNNMYQKHHTKEAKKKIGLASKKRNKGKNNGNAKTFKVIDPNGVEYLVNGELVSFARIHNLSVWTLAEMARGNYPSKGSSIGWKCSYL